MWRLRSPGYPLRGSLYADLHEDFWEDSSVSLESPREWGLPIEGILEDKATLWSLAMLKPEKGDLWHCIEEEPSLKGDSPVLHPHSRIFPPPVDSCATLSFKEGGRLVLKEACGRRQGFFRAERGNGRLRLHLIRSCVEDDHGGDCVDHDDYDDDRVPQKGSQNHDHGLPYYMFEDAITLCSQMGNAEGHMILDFGGNEIDENGPNDDAADIF